MIFGNNIEQMGFEKSGWVIVDQSADGNTVYMGKPSTADAKPADAAWHIRKVTTEVQTDGSQLIMTQHAEPEGKCVWADRKNLEYLPNLKDIRKFILNNIDTSTGLLLQCQYSFEYGMTWREWVVSKYNVDNFVIEPVTSMYGDQFDGVICNENHNFFDDADSIISDSEYVFEEDYTGFPDFGGDWS